MTIRLLRLSLVVALLAALTPRAGAAAEIIHLSPGRMVSSPFLFQIEARQRTGVLLFHVRIIKTVETATFDQAPALSLSTYGAGAESTVKGGKFVSIRLVRPLSVRRGRSSLDCQLAVSVEEVQDGRLCFAFQHDGGLDVAPYLPSRMPEAVFFLASLKDFMPVRR